MTERWTLADPALKATVTKRSGPGNLLTLLTARDVERLTVRELKAKLAEAEERLDRATMVLIAHVYGGK
ncbi:hypothetical protein GEORGE_68 [Mycobacterium phage George]|uniref:Uncharacterized protein n=1 Tax=Mycobacterium phage George TaxID=2920883 RepID=G1BQB4_9CAUD|nr:hypothetical protein FGG53_gp20 [Mycobacterium phage George]AEK32636.1 hypothetical protein GEORGE_68 [Mycobacterium phage George]